MNIIKSLRLMECDIDNIIYSSNTKIRSEELISEALSSIDLPGPTLRDSYESILTYYSYLLLYCVSNEEYEMAAKIKKLINIEYKEMLYKTKIRLSYNNNDEDNELYDDIKVIFSNVMNFIKEEQDKLLK